MVCRPADAGPEGYVAPRDLTQSRKDTKVSEREVTYDFVDAIFKNRFTKVN